MLIKTKIRKNFLHALSSLISQGDELTEPQTGARNSATSVSVSSLNAGTGGADEEKQPRKFGDCCIIYQTIEFTVDLEARVCVSADKCMQTLMESEIDALELRAWPLIGDFIKDADKNGICIQYIGNSPSQSDPEEDDPYVRQTLSFSVTYKFNPSEPESILVD